MTRELHYSSKFIQLGKKVAKKYPHLKEDVKLILSLLSEDAYQPKLKPHKLKGELKDYWACSVAYDLRIIFQITEVEGKEVILLHSIGTHDDVY